ncbi:hypothetical protein B296_00027507 [Ensete ventricosum]|uniref:Uncharacterized protein n=1 Tax=Ensete ventricosum TaxID=4639 RepID=A0A426XWX0_ENSVE|nr:hypothetical protein B296_00027507 [Ensete ventricosum]
MGSRGEIVEKQGWPRRWQGGEEQRWPAEEEVAEGRKDRGGLGYGGSDWEENEAMGSSEGCDSGRAVGSGEEAREEGEEGVIGATTEEGYGQLEVVAGVVKEERRWWPGRGGSGV